MNYDETRPSWMEEDDAVRLIELGPAVGVVCAAGLALCLGAMAAALVWLARIEAELDDLNDLHAENIAVQG